MRSKTDRKDKLCPHIEPERRRMRAALACEKSDGWPTVAPSHLRDRPVRVVALRGSFVVGLILVQPLLEPPQQGVQILNQSAACPFSTPPLTPGDDMFRVPRHLNHDHKPHTS